MKLYNINYDCASKNEIQNILHNGIDNKKILFANPSKIDTHILFAKEQNIPLMTFDSLEELNKIKLIFPDAKLIIRLKVDESYSDLKFNSKFGVDMVEAEYLLNRAKTLDLNVVGVSFHVGSKCNNSEVYRQSIYSCRILYDIAKTIGYKLSILDIGGGFPGYDDYIFRKMAMEIHCGLHEYFNKTSVSFIAEPGRYFATSAYTLVCKIINKKIIKEDNNKKIIYYINESIYGSFNNILTDRADIMINTLKPDNVKFISTIFGPTCDSLDCIALNVKLPELEVNDYIYFDNMGAYTVSSATNFNGFSHAKVKYILY
jgi:ornithine decarboxylase